MSYDPLPRATSSTPPLTLEDLVAVLSSSREVDGVLLLGSAAAAGLRPESDLDLLLVLNELPLPLRMVNTWVGGRFAEVYCTTTAAVASAAAAHAPGGSEMRLLGEWLRRGRIAYDRSGLLVRVQQALQRVAADTRPPDAAVYAAWREIGYNAAHMRRYLASADPLAPTVVDVRMLYSLMEVILGYFTVRRMPWQGEKTALRYLEVHDPEFLGLLRCCLAETDRRGRAVLYFELASRAVAPVGPLWKEGDTVVQLGPPWGADDTWDAANPEEALGFWQRLTGTANV